MAVKGSGALSILNDIVAEFGGTAPHSLSEYYGGGTYVPAGANPGIATSGAINFGSHYGAVAATVLNIISNVNNYDIGAAAIAAGGDKSTPVILTINAGVTVGSTSTGTAAMYTGTGWSSGTTINITNNGSIVGANGSNTSAYGGGGGTGGAGGYHSSWIGYGGSSGGAGGSGTDSVNNAGHSFEHSQTSDNNLSVIFDTTGTRTGGSAGSKTSYGGGGGGGGGVGFSANWRRGGGGGGGAGSPVGVGGASDSNASCCGTVTYGGGYKRAESGTLTTGGRGNENFQSSGYGGNGGSNGNSGGSSGGSSGGAGGSTTNTSGSAGSALAGNTGQIS